MPRSPLDISDEVARAWMRAALKLAAQADAEGEVPVGALVLDGNGKELSAAWNRTVGLQDPTAHAETLALRRAAAVMRNPRLERAILVTTLEPCTMCLGAMLEARIEMVISGADDPRCGALDLAEHQGFRGRVRRGVEEADCSRLLRAYFARKRADDRGGV